MKFIDSKNTIGKIFRGVALLLLAGIFTLTANAGTGVVTVTANGNSCIDYTAAQGGGPDNWEVAEGGSYTMTLTGVTECSTDEVLTVFVQNSSTGNFCFNVTSTGNTGEYAGTFTVPDQACFTMPISYKCGANQSCDNSNTFEAMGPSGSSTVHLRASNFDGNCVRTGTDEDCGEETHEDPTIQCPSDNIVLCDDGENIVTFSVTATNNGCDGEPTVTQIAGPVSGSSFDIGTTTITFEATDNCGGSATCSFTVTINAAPTVSISAEGPTTVCSPGCVTLTASGADTYEWSTGETTTSISACSSGDYTVRGTTEGCSDDADAPVHVTINPPPTVTVSADGPTTVCSPSCVTLNASGAETYEWSTGATGSSISACSSGLYSVTGTAANGCTDASDPIEVTVNPTPSCTLTAPDPLPICGLSGNSLTVSITGAYTNIVWNASPSSWVINSGQGTPTISYKAGNSGTQGTFTVTVTNAFGCSSTCTVTFGSRCEEHCGYTQGFYSGSNGSNNGKMCNGTTTAIQGINAALSSGNLVNGITGVSAVTILTSEGSCLQGKLPSGTTPTALPANTNITCAGLTGGFLAGGKIKNNLLGQTIVLGLNMRLDASLGSVVITGPYMTTYKATACTNGVATGTKLVKPIPQSVINCLNASGNNTVAGLRDLANRALAGQLGTCTAPIGDINTAVEAFNSGFDGCRILAGFGTSSTGLREIGEENAILDQQLNQGGLELSIYPNPTNTITTLLFRSQENANASVDLYDFSGQKVSALYHGSVDAGQPMGVEMDASSLAPGIYLLVLQTETTSVSQKVVIMK